MSDSHRHDPRSAPTLSRGALHTGKRGDRALLLAGVVVSLVACGGSAPSTSKTGPEEIDACGLLTAEEVAETLAIIIQMGERRDAGVTRDGAYSSTCLWRVPLAEGQQPDPAKPLGGAQFAILNVMSWPDSVDAGKFLQAFRDAAEDHVIPREPVPLELGDEALWWGDGVAVRKGDISFGISVFIRAPDRSALRQMEESLARKILQRL